MPNSPDRVVKVTEQGWFSRIGESIKGIVAGGLMFVISMPLLFTNEGRAVQTARSLSEGSGVVVTVAPDRVDPANDGRLVHVAGEAETGDTLSDPTFGVALEAIGLDRTVEMYQWVERAESETERRVGGKEVTTTTYTYERAWQDEPVSSAGFEQPEGHANPGAFPFTSSLTRARNVTVGAYRLPGSLIEQIDSFEPLPLSAEQLPAELGDRARVLDGGVYIGVDPATPAIGDVRVRFQVVRPTMVSAIAQQFQGGLAPYQTEAGDALAMLRVGTHTASAMFAQAQSANTAWTWVVRLGGFLLMFLGLFLVFNPIAVVADVLPILGTMLRLGVGLFAGLVAAALSLLTIAIAWVFYRPVLGISLLVLGMGLLMATWRFGRQTVVDRTVNTAADAAGS